MSECKICGTGCQWVFCGDCEKLIGNGIDEYDRTIADLTAKLKLAVEALGDYEDVCHNCGENENQHDENGLVDKMDEYGRMVCGNPLYRVRKALKQIGEQL